MLVWTIILFLLASCTPIVECRRSRNTPSSRTTSAPTYFCNNKLTQYTNCVSCLNTTESRSWCLGASGTISDYCFPTGDLSCISNCNGEVTTSSYPLNVGKCKVNPISTIILLALLILLCCPCCCYAGLYFSGYNMSRNGIHRRNNYPPGKIMPVTTMNSPQVYPQQSNFEPHHPQGAEIQMVPPSGYPAQYGGQQQQMPYGQPQQQFVQSAYCGPQPMQTHQGYAPIMSVNMPQQQQQMAYGQLSQQQFGQIQQPQYGANSETPYAVAVPM